MMHFQLAGSGVMSAYGAEGVNAGNDESRSD